MKNYILIILCFLFFLISCISKDNNVRGEVETVFNFKKRVLLQDYLDNKIHSEKINVNDFDIDEKSISFENVAPLISLNCVPCHKPEGNAPFSLISYNALKRKAAVIKEVLEDRIMPPWMADHDYNSFFNAPELSDSSRAFIISWINKGCPKYSEIKSVDIDTALTIKSIPDLVLTRDSDHIITSNDDTYHCFIYDPKLDSDTYFSGVEFISSNPEVIHHLTLFLDTSAFSANEADCWDCKHTDLDMSSAVPVQSWTRGMKPFVLNPALAFKIPKGARFILQAHYSDENNKGRLEKTTLKLFFVKKPQEVISYDVVNKNDLFYPANEIVTEQMSYFIKDSISLFGLVPHMHFLAKKFECFAITPNNEIIELLKISNWDYLWQGQYIFNSLLMIPAGSTIYANIVVDNTSENPTQPNNPVRDVLYNKGASDEMFILVFMKKKYIKGDENLKVAKFLN